ncbi:TonB-dependent receptor domain-containing protein [Wenyingzhuangia sp. IMCC45533]
MRNLLVAFLTLITALTYAQSKGKITGNVKDKDLGLEPLPFVSVYVEGNTQVGTTTDFDGNYALPLLPGKHIIVFDFVGYKPVKKAINVVAGKTQNISVVMETLADALDAIVITAVTNKESETALIAEQKEAVSIIESIGAEQLSQQGVSDAAEATTKVVGVTKSASSGDVFVRGLGDRYLLTTLNGLPISSDNVDKKNINLNLFSNDIIQNVGISKTYLASTYGDQTSGRVDVTTSVYNDKDFKISFGTGINSNVAENFSNFRTTQNLKDINFLGFYNQTPNVLSTVRNESFDPESLDFPLNYSLSISKGYKFNTKIGDLKLYTTLSNERSFDYETGVFQQYNANNLTDSYTDTELFELSSTTTGLVDFSLKINSENNLQWVNLFVNKVKDQLYESGRNGEGFKLDNQPRADVGSFLRDQNLKETQIFVSQLLGIHNLKENNTLKWATAFNYLIADEPNRIRNEFVIGDGTTRTDNTPIGVIAPSTNNNFQQRKFSQEVDDIEISAFIKDEIGIIQKENQSLKLNTGIDVRYRTREFESVFVGLDVRNNTLSSLDNFSVIANEQNFASGSVTAITRPEDTYSARLLYTGAYLTTTYNINKLTVNLGLRAERNQIEVTRFDVTNFFNRETNTPRIGDAGDTYSNLLPQLDLKYEVIENLNFRMSLSKTFTLPEFKELAPFQYQTPTGRTIVGNPDLQPSTNYNVDTKLEYFFSEDELFSLTGFYKNIQDPINFTIQTGAAGNFTYANTGEKALVFGLEAEARVNLLKMDDDKLRFIGNISYTNHEQDLFETFQFNNRETSGLAGASDWIINGGLNYNSGSENEKFNLNLTGNYFSDKIFAVGAPRDQANRNLLFNEEIIEESFVTLDLVASKVFNDFTIKFAAKNILNPNIDQTQDVLNLTDETTITNELVSRYKRGVDYSLSLSYKF